MRKALTAAIRATTRLTQLFRVGLIRASRLMPIAPVSLMLLTMVVACTAGSVSEPTASDARSPAVSPSVGPTASPSAVPSPSTVAATTTPVEILPTHSLAPSVSPEPSGSPGKQKGHGGKGKFHLPDGPPPVTISTADTSFKLEAWTYCYGNACVDGRPPHDLPDVGTADRVEVEFPLEEWTFGATFVEVGVACPRRQWAALSTTGDGTHVLEPAGPAGAYDVTLAGRGNGDLFVTFRWTTPHDGPMPVPEASLSVLADRDGEVDSYGVALSLSGLAETPRSATAEVTVTAANGRSLTFKPVRDKRRCVGEGALYWDGPDKAGEQAAELGPAPFTYEVVLVLDGVRYTGTATWPDDLIEGEEPYVSLVFTPPLPALP